MKHGFNFILTDQGCFISCIQDKCVMAEGYFENPGSLAHSQVLSLLKKYYKAPIVLYLDTLNQTFFDENIPATDIFARRKIIKNLIQEHKNPSNAVISYKKNSDNQQFIVAQLTSVNTEWLIYLSQLENPLQSVRSLPLEACHILHSLRQAKPLSIVTYYAPFIGIRQCVFLHNQFYLSRLIAPAHDDVGAILARETQDLIAYIRRDLPWLDRDDIDIVTLGPQEVYTKLPPKSFIHLSAQQIQTLWGFTSHTEEDHFLSSLSWALSGYPPKDNFDFDLLKDHKTREWGYKAISILTWAGLVFSGLYGASTLYFNAQKKNNIPLMKQQITTLKSKAKNIAKDHPNVIPAPTRDNIQRVQRELDRQAEALQNPLESVPIFLESLPEYWEVKEIDWLLHSPRYNVEHPTLSNPNIRHPHTFYEIEATLRFKGPHYQGPRMMDILINDPDLQRFNITVLEQGHKLYKIKITERTSP